MRQAGCVAACPAAGCSRLQSFICCGPTIPQVWSGIPSAGLEARRAGTDGIHSVLSGRRGSDEIRFMVGGGRPKADHMGFWLSDCGATVPSIDDFGPAVVFQAAFAASSALVSVFDQRLLSEQKYGMNPRPYDDLTRGFPASSK